METDEIQQIVREINNSVRTNSWFDFELLSYSRQQLTIVGAIDLTWTSAFSIHFIDVFFVSMTVDWRTDTSKDFLIVLEGNELREFNLKYHIEIGYFVFKFLSEYGAGIYVISKCISYSIEEKKLR